MGWEQERVHDAELEEEEEEEKEEEEEEEEEVEEEEDGHEPVRGHLPRVSGGGL